MHTRVFVIEFLSALLKSNIKRIDILKDDIFAFFSGTIQSCTLLNLELKTIIECVFDLIYTCINYNVIPPIHKLLSLLDSVVHLPPEIAQPLAPLLVSGISVLIEQYRLAIPIIGCWETLISLLVPCLQEPYALNRCYRCILLMFSNETAKTLPPSTLSLIDAILQSPFVAPSIFSELMEDLLLLNQNCWKILTRLSQDDAGGATFQNSLQTIWRPLLDVVCRECRKASGESAEIALTAFWVGLTRFLVNE